MADKTRPLHILKYLWDHTDEEHSATIVEILSHLESSGIHTNRKTVASDLQALQESGFDLIHSNTVVDVLHAAIQRETTVEFQYIEYTPEKKKSLKHGVQVYRLSPYDLVWNNDSYYIFGWSESHGKVVKFRVDRMHQPRESNKAYYPRPEEYDIEDSCEQVFMMYDGKPCTVTLRCANEVMKAIVDRFGEDVKTAILIEGHFSAEVEVSASPTFYSWLFTYGGRIMWRRTSRNM